MTYPNYNPITESSDFPAILKTTEQMYADLNAQQDGCCKSKSTLEVLCQADIFLQDITIVGEVGSDNYNLERWQEDIKCAYILLSSFFRLSAEVSPAPVVPFPSDVLLEIERGKQYFSNLTQEYISDLKRGCSDCKPLSFECLKRLLRALDYKVELAEYDEIAEKLVYKMQVIIGGYKLVVPLIAYWWLSNEGDAPLTASEIITKNQVEFTSGGNITIPFTGVVFKVLNIAYPNSQTSKTAYINVNDSSDFGTLGTSGDLLGAVLPTGSFKQQNGNYLVNGNRTLKFS